jgi:hypothetical protein
MLYGGNRCVTVLAKGKGGRFLESCYEDRGSVFITNPQSKTSQNLFGWPTKISSHGSKPAEQV